MIEQTIRLPFAAADPFILPATDGRYYLYATSEDGSGFPVHVSNDLHSWRACGAALDAARARWGAGCFWAPECYEIDGKYYLFYSADWKENPTGALENFRIGVAVADTPAGPFADLSDRPVFDPATRSSTPTSTGRTAAATCTIPAAATSTVSASGRKAGSTAWSSSRTFPA